MTFGSTTRVAYEVQRDTATVVFERATISRRQFQRTML